MSVESTTQALCDLALRFGEGDEDSMVCIGRPILLRDFIVFERQTASVVNYWQCCLFATDVG